MRVVVAGSSGLIGTALVAHLRAGGHEVLRLVRRTAGAGDEHEWDPAAGHGADAALDGADAVVNLCGVGIGDKRWTGSYKQQIRDSRIAPTEVLARAVLAQGVPTFLSASAVGYYGDTGDAVVTEASPAGPDFLSQVCADWEGAALPAAAAARVVLLRTGLVLAPSGGLLGRLKPLYSLGLGGRLGSGRQYYPWVSLDDQVAAIAFALENPAISGPMNVTGPAPVTNAEFSRALAAVLHRPAPWVVPGFALRAVLGEFATEGVLAGQRAVPAVLQQAGYRFRHADVASALRAACR
ncbi:TIGR01777 family oxidoreductase [Rhodococcus sp. X156]|uniref:TIGR01777 family oxidoreductase n=1 Tax=Rhodococcus sp. X156 TaxID=2499145 RepID=UPI000FDA87C1|nr:TIGR01777 family oxidoreductase [Rhodococcus sp. X156]